VRFILSEDVRGKWWLRDDEYKLYQILQNDGENMLFNLNYKLATKRWIFTFCNKRVRISVLQ
jgi:hypothetical protein